YSLRDRQHVHSFPTRRSSDLADWRSTQLFGRGSKRGGQSLRRKRAAKGAQERICRQVFPAIWHYVQAWTHHKTSSSAALRRTGRDRKSTRLNSSHRTISNAAF